MIKHVIMTELVRCVKLGISKRGKRARTSAILLLTSLHMHPHAHRFWLVMGLLKCSQLIQHIPEKNIESESTRTNFHSYTHTHRTNTRNCGGHSEEFAEMAEEEGAPQPQPPPADSFCLASATQPYPRSPKTLRKPDADPLGYSQEQLSRWLEELEKESKWTEAHMASLKKRQANLSVRAKRMVFEKVQSVMFNTQEKSNF
ncbi:hypothetical protein AMELA_G00109710 [Ameiurus melas]|uniref:Uncharacterized protein n=1 Tax=Ameiurus melas TaxID=219545 RepID=A0A7J6ARK4_AMEME|nr:hypothetical protein AMELA_G00109710 [Ameiurus melas]